MQRWPLAYSKQTYPLFAAPNKYDWCQGRFYSNMLSVTTHFPRFNLPRPYLISRYVGALQYLCITRPDINYAVNQVSQFMHSPTEAHWSSVKRILRYLKGTSPHGLFFQPSSNFQISAYSDADWASNIEDRKSSLVIAFLSVVIWSLGALENSGQQLVHPLKLSIERSLWQLMNFISFVHLWNNSPCLLPTLPFSSVTTWVLPILLLTPFFILDPNIWKLIFIMSETKFWIMNYEFNIFPRMTSLLMS